MAEEIIRVEHLKKYFDVRSNSLLKKEKKIVKAVDDINFTINKGQILGIVGESGCGNAPPSKRQLCSIRRVDG